MTEILWDTSHVSGPSYFVGKFFPVTPPPPILISNLLHPLVRSQIHNSSTHPTTCESVHVMAV